MCYDLGKYFIFAHWVRKILLTHCMFCYEILINCANIFIFYFIIIDISQNMTFHKYVTK